MEMDPISESSRLTPVYGNRLTNHLPMVLSALKKMGADESRLKEYTEKTKERMNLTPPLSDNKTTLSITDKNWREYRGTHQYYNELIPFFTQRIRKDGVNDTLSYFLRFLLPGMIGGAFHGMIRLGYAAESGDAEQIARGLAYWTDVYQEVPVYTTRNLTANPLGSLKELADHPYFSNLSLSGNNIMERVEQVANDKRFAEVMTDLHTPLITEEVNRNLVKAAYALTEDFTVLHAVTAIHAIRMLKPWWRDYVIPLRVFWRYLQAAYLSTGCVPFADHLPAVSPGITWEMIKAEAIKSDDDHTIKLVYTCWQEFQIDHDDLYMELAYRRIQKTK